MAAFFVGKIAANGKQRGGEQHMEQEAKKGYYNETTNTAGGIPTPPDREDIGPFDSLNEIVEGIMDNIENAFDGGE
jgi:hypothetical protein